MRRARRLSRARRLALAPRPSAVVRQRLRREILALARAWVARVRRILSLGLAETLRADASDESLLRRVRAVADDLPYDRLERAGARLGRVADAHAREELLRALPRMRVQEVVPGADDAVRAWRSANVGLVRSLLSAQAARLEAVLEGNEGLHPSSLAGRLEAVLGVTEARAELLARDQTGKLAADVNEARQVAAGVTRYVWTTVGDERVREMHRDLDGEEFSWDDPPVTNEQGDANHPGQDYSCRCSAIPVVDALESDD